MFQRKCLSLHRKSILKNMKKILIACLLQAFLLPVAAATEMEMADTTRVQDLDEVVVVSQPKEQVRLRLQPLASTVLVGDQLNRLQVRDLSQLSQFVPSFTMPSYGSRLTSSMYVRGIGSRINNPAVGIYYDNVPLMSKSAFNNHFYMIDRVDVMRGPQGTLYGQNTEGGLVRIYSKNPMSYQGTDVALGIGTGLYSNVEVAHYHRPSNNFAFSVAGFYSGLKGYIDNQNFDEKNDLTNETGGRMRLIWQPTQKLSFDLTTDYQYVNQNGFGYGEFSPIEVPGSFCNTMEDQTDAIAKNLTVQDPATTFMNGYKRNMLNTGLNISYHTDRLLFTSTTSHQYLRDLMLMDQDYMTPDYLRLEQRQKQNSVTQEFVLRSHDTSRWQHASGLFGSYQWLRTDAPVYFGEAITGPIGDGITAAMKNAMYQAMYGRMYQQMLQQMLERGMPQAVAEAAAQVAAAQAAQTAIDAAGITMSAEMAVPEYFHTPSMNAAVFHESNIQLTDRLKLTLGLRFNVDKMKISYNSLGYMSITGGTAVNQATYNLTSHVVDTRSKTYTQLLPKLGLTYSLGEQLGNVYALISKGYRAGGYNIQMFSDILQTDLNAHQQDAMRGDYDVEHLPETYDAIEEAISYKPEESWNYELGTHLNLFGGSTHFDLAFFYMQIRNQQLSQMSPLYNYGRIISNAGKSHSLGLEAALRGKAAGNALDWAVTYAFTSAKFDEYAYSFNMYSSLGNDWSNYDGNYVPFVPQHTFNVMFDAHIGKFTIGETLTGQGKTWWDEANTFSQKFYTVLGAHVDYDFGLGVVSLWGRNLTNTKYNTFAVQSSAANGTRYFAQKANLFHAGIDIRLHF